MEPDHLQKYVEKEMEYNLPPEGALYKRGHQFKKVISVLSKKQGPPDIMYIVPGKKRVFKKDYSFWADWVRGAVIIE